MDPQDYGILKLHAHQSAQKAQDGVTALLEAGRYDYLEGKDKVSFAESTGVRHVEESGSGRARETAAGAPANR